MLEVRRSFAQRILVSSERDYSLRAASGGGDEVGVLVFSFNQMLEDIQERDTALQQTHSSLEKRVAERTAYLNALIEASPLAIMVLDPDENIQLCNPAFERLFQYSDGSPLNASARVTRQGGTARRSEGHYAARARWGAYLRGHAPAAKRRVIG